MAVSPFIDTVDYPSVRRAIAVNLTATDIPDLVIGDPIYLDRSAAEILALDPLAETRTGLAELAIQRAMILQLAANLIQALPQITQERFVDYSVTFAGFNGAARRADLLKQVQSEIASVLGSGSGSSRLPGLALGKACPRGASAW